jgi:hypothetical protein
MVVLPKPLDERPMGWTDNPNAGEEDDHRGDDENPRPKLHRFPPS